MTALDELLMKKYRESIAGLTSDVSTVSADVPATVDSEPNLSTFETLVTSIGGPSPMSVPPIHAGKRESLAESVDAAKETTAATDTEEHEAKEQIPKQQAPIETKTLDPVDVIQMPEVADIEPTVPLDEPSDSKNVAASLLRELEPEEFKAEWEIDRFPWPGICGEVEERIEDQLSEALERIKLACLARDGNSIVLTSAITGAGRTTMTLCLAREAARQGMSVAVVEMDHAAPVMLSNMGIDFEKGIESLTEPGISVRDISLVAVEDGVTLIPASCSFDVSLCISLEMRQLLVTVSKHHDLVLIDASREVADALSASPTQGIVMVNNPESREATEAFLEWIKEKNAWTVGIIENFAA